MVAPLGVRHPGHQRVVDVRVGLEGLLDLLRVHLLAAGVDALRAAPEDGDHALLVDRGHVAEQHPPLAVPLEEGPGGLGGVVVVAERHMSALGDPAHLAGRHRLIGGRVHDLRTGVDADPEAPLGTRVLGRRAVETGLGRAEVVQQHGVRHQLLELPPHRVRHDRAGRRHAEQRRAVDVLQRTAQRVDQGPQHRVAHQRDAADPLLLQGPQHFLGHELAVDHDPLPEVEADERREGGGAVHQRGRGEEGDPRAAGRDPLGEFLRLLHRLTGRGAPAETREEQILLPPHHSLGHPGRTAGVDDELVVGRTCREVACRRPRGLGIRELRTRHLGGPRRRSTHPDQMPQLLRTRPGRRHPVGELGVEDQRHQIRVPVEVHQLLFDVPVVDVDRDDPGLQAAQHRLQVLHPVVEVETEVLTGPYPAVEQMVADAVGRRVQLRVRQTALRARTGMVGVHQRLTAGDDVDDRLEQVGKVVLHRSS